MEQKWGNTNPFDAFKQQPAMPEVELKAPDVKEALKQIRVEPKQAVMKYCAVCGMRAEACQHENGMLSDNTYGAVDDPMKSSYLRDYPDELKQVQERERGVQRRCGCF